MKSITFLLNLSIVLSLPIRLLANTTVVDDTFADSSSRNQDLSANSLNIFDGRTGATGAGGGASFTRTDALGSMTLGMAGSSSSQGAWAFFTGDQAVTTESPSVSSGAWGSATPIDLKVGETLTFVETFSIGGLKTGQDIRLGLFDSGGSRNTANGAGGQNDASFANDLGYSLDFYPSGGSTPFTIGKRDLVLAAGLSSLNNLFLQITSFPALPGVSGAVMPTLQTLSNDLPYTLTFSIYRQDASTNILTATVTGSTVTGSYSWQAVDTSSPQSTFDSFTAARFNGSAFADTITFTEFKVIYALALPVITAQPTFASGNTAQTVPVGGQAIISASASGSGLTYQWNQDGISVPGATSPNVTLTNLQLTDSGEYTLVITNSAGSVTSTPVSLTVVTGSVSAPPSITAQPLSQTVLNDSNVVFTVTVIGEGLTYQWSKNKNAVTGATSASLSLPSAQAADAASYTVTVSNDGGSSTSLPAVLTVISSHLASAAFSPATSAIGLCIDTPLKITFASPPSFGTTGTIRIYDAATDTVVDTIDVSSPSQTGNISFLSGTPYQTKTIGGVGSFNYYPVMIAGSVAQIYLRNGVLGYSKTYYVQIDSGVFKDSLGVYAGITDKTAWRFTTKAGAPASGSTLLTVAADGSGDFCTVQGALDFIPNGNTTRTTIFIRKGTYTEEVYFASKHSLTFQGEDRKQTVITYPNNNNFNPVGGVYHRGVFLGNSANDTVVTNLTIKNSTPQNGTQAEALIINGTVSAHTIVTRVDLYSYQDTLQINGQAYLSENYVEGDVDFMWGKGPCFFSNCDFKILRPGGYFTQIRNDNTGHGYVFLNCRLTAAAGDTATYLARIDPTPGLYPYSEVVWLNCRMGNFVSPAGWLINNATTAPNVRFWEYNSTDELGQPLDVSGREAFSHQLALPADEATITNYSTPSYVLGGWTPLLAPIITSQPMGVIMASGQRASFSVITASVPVATFQWLKNGVPISGATSAFFSIPSVGSTDIGSYAVIVSNGTVSVTSEPASLWLAGTPPTLTAQPAFQAVIIGGTAKFSVVATGTSPFSYQWKRNGLVLPGAVDAVLTLTNVQASDAGTYTVAVTNIAGDVTSNAALLTVSIGAFPAPPLPTIPAGVFNITSYGAIADGVTDNTTAIQAAINAAQAAGGGTIVFPAAAKAYESGPITIYSNMNFQVDFGAKLQALPFGEYPKSTTSPAHFITVNSGSTNIMITGSGTIDGNGDAWWTAYKNSTITVRPRLVQINRANTMLITGVTLQNSPMFHLAFSASNNITIAGITISAPATSPNTDGIDPAGLHYLIENCSIAVGDDNIAVKAGSAANGDITVTNCTFGVGHGLSIGGQTNAGLDGMLVDHCTFNGTTSGLRMKADATQGGIVQNVTYSNLTMVNVPNPIVFYSYYTQVGSPGATSGSSRTTPAKVNLYNAMPPNPLDTVTLPGWRNITITNLTATGASGYSILWGLPLADQLIQNVTLNNVEISGGAGFEIYDSSNVQFTGTTSVGPVITCNALAITSQPKSQMVSAGADTTFTVEALGGSGVSNSAPIYQWKLNGLPVSDGTALDGAFVSGSTTPTLTINNVQAAEAGNYSVTVSNSLDGFDIAAGVLAPNSLPVSATSQDGTLTIANAFISFIASYGLDPATTGRLSADPDGDGIPNGLEFLLGGNPTKANSSILPTSNMLKMGDTLQLVYEFDQNKAAAKALTVIVEYSSDLVSWTAAIDGHDGITFVITPGEASNDHVAVVIPAPGGRLFARVRVTY